MNERMESVWVGGSIVCMARHLTMHFFRFSLCVCLALSIYLVLKVSEMW